VVLHDGFGIDQAVREQADWLGGAGYLALSADLGFWPALRCALHEACPIVASFGARDRALRKAPRRLALAAEQLGIEHDIKVYPEAGHAFLHQSADQPGPVRGILTRITHAGYHEASARDARSRVIAFFDAHLKQ